MSAPFAVGPPTDVTTQAMQTAAALGAALQLQKDAAHDPNNASQAALAAQLAETLSNNLSYLMSMQNALSQVQQAQQSMPQVDPLPAPVPVPLPNINDEALCCPAPIAQQAFVQAEQEEEQPDRANRESREASRQSKKREKKKEKFSTATDPCKYKSKLCRNWRQYGRCDFGSACSFAHGDTELRDRGENVNIMMRLGLQQEQLVPRKTRGGGSASAGESDSFGSTPATPPRPTKKQGGGGAIVPASPALGYGSGSSGSQLGSSGAGTDVEDRESSGRAASDDGSHDEKTSSATASSVGPNSSDPDVPTKSAAAEDTNSSDSTEGDSGEHVPGRIHVLQLCNMMSAAQKEAL